jgi:hypothetical protein
VSSSSLSPATTATRSFICMSWHRVSSDIVNTNSVNTHGRWRMCVCRRDLLAHSRSKGTQIPRDGNRIEELVDMMYQDDQCAADPHKFNSAIEYYHRSRPQRIAQNSASYMQHHDGYIHANNCPRVSHPESLRPSEDHTYVTHNPTKPNRHYLIYISYRLKIDVEQGLNSTVSARYSAITPSCCISEVAFQLM